MVSRLEALADAISYYHQTYKPDSNAYKLRNPGLLRAISLKYPRDENGFRVFNSILDGYQALLFDLRLKCSGKSKIKTEDNLKSLLVDGYKQVIGSVPYITSYLRKALQLPDNFLFSDTTLNWFLED